MALHGTSDARRSDCLMVTDGVSSEWGQLGSVGGQSGVSCIGQHFMFCQMLIHALPSLRVTSLGVVDSLVVTGGQRGQRGQSTFHLFFLIIVGDVI